jgi:hypothetical protein
MPAKGHGSPYPPDKRSRKAEPDAQVTPSVSAIGSDSPTGAGAEDGTFSFLVAHEAEPGNILPSLAALLIELSEREQPEGTGTANRNKGR